MLSFAKKENEEVALMIDIGNGSVSGAFVLIRKELQPVFLYALTVPFPLSLSLDSQKLTEDMETVLDSLLVYIQKGFEHEYWKDKNKKIGHVLVSFSSPWFILRTKHIHVEQDNPFLITKSFIDDITQKEEALLENEMNKGVEVKEKDSFEVIEKSIVHTKINGYELNQSIGTKTKSFDAFLCMSVVSKKVLKNVTDIIAKHVHLGTDKIFLHTFPLISFSVVRDILSPGPDFVLLDVTSEVTELTLVSGEVIVETVTMPSGRNFIIRKIAEAFGVSSEIAESNLHLYTLQKMDTPSETKMREVLENVEKEWAIYFENALLEIKNLGDLPRKMYITTDNDVSEIYKNFLSVQKMDGTAEFRKNLQAFFLSDSSFFEYFSNESGRELDTFIILLTIFYNRIRQNS